MAKLTRVNQKIFGKNAGVNQIAKFGSFAAGSPAYTTDPSMVQALSNWLAGWFDAVDGNNSPAIEDWNAFCFVMAYQLAYIFENGAPEWNAQTNYFEGSIVNDTSTPGKLYYSLIDDNLNNLVSDDTKWHLVLPISDKGSIAVGDSSGDARELVAGQLGAAPMSNPDAELGLSNMRAYGVWNHSIAVSVAANALTVAVKTANGDDPSPEDPVIVAFRSDGADDGLMQMASITEPLSITVPNGATLGLVGSIKQLLWMYFLLEDGVVDLSISSRLLGQHGVQAPTQVSTGADDNDLYSAGSHTGSFPIALAGRIRVTEVTPGQWATAPDLVSSRPTVNPNPGIVYAKDIQTSGTAAQTLTAGSYVKRNLNTLDGDGVSSGAAICKMSASQITLSPGEYKIHARAALNTGNPTSGTFGKLKIRNVTDSADIAIGQTSFANNPSSDGSVVATYSDVATKVTITKATVIEIQHRSNNSAPGGSTASFGDSEVYCVVEIQKLDYVP